MSKEFQEPEEKELNSNLSDVEIMDDFNPLDEAVNEKEYTKHNVKVNPNDFNADIPEPSFSPPPMSGGLKQEEKNIKPKEPFNPQVKDMSKKDKQMASKRVADMCMTAYKWVNKFADSQLQFDERKIAKMEMDGQIDLSVEIPISATVSMSAGEFIQEYNEQSKNTIVVTKEFEDEVMPVLIDVLEEEGISMTKKQELAYLIGKDVAVKGFMGYQNYKVKKDTLKMLMELNKNIKASNVINSQPRQQEYTPPPQQPTTPEPIYQEEQVYVKPHDPVTNVNDFVNEMTGGINPNDIVYQPQTEVPVPSEVNFTPYNDSEITNDYQEPKPKVKVITDGVKKSIKRGRPKRK
jgi:hypothetical protein